MVRRKLRPHHRRSLCMQFDRFDVCAAFYWYAVQYNNGQGSKGDLIIGRLMKLAYKPSQAIQHGELNHNAALIFHKLAEQTIPHPGGYKHCDCRDCFETTISAAFCDACERAECGIGQACMCEDEDDSSDYIEDDGVFRCPDCGG